MSVEEGSVKCVDKDPKDEVPDGVELYDPEDCLMSSSSSSESSDQPQSSESSEDHRPLRKRKRTSLSKNCPLCGITLRHEKIGDHYDSELRKLDSLQKKKRKLPEESVGYKTLDMVRSNRKKRCQGSKQTKDIGTNTCDICLNDDPFEAVPSCSASALHLVECVGLGSNMADITDESEESFEEYSIGGEERIRTSSLIDSLDDLPHDHISHTEEDDVIIIDSDDDDDATFGPSQFSEHDLQPCESTLSDANTAALREAVLSSSNRSSVKISNMQLSSDKDDDELDAIFGVPETAVSNASSNATEIQKRRSSSSTNIVMSALRSKLEELEEEMKNSSAKCNICMEAYKEPLVSVTCWHVSCKECWMKTLGERKLCPQCAKITLPSKLRRIFI